MVFKLKKYSLLLCAITVGLPSLLHAQSSATEPAQEPLISSVQMPAPNIMLSVDTSGSMGAVAIPDALATAIWGSNTSTQMYQATLTPGDYGLTGTANPRNQQVYALSSEKTNIAAALGRSPQINKIYYNPAIHYQPWMRADGTRMAPADPKSTRLFASGAYDANVGIDLTVVGERRNATFCTRVTFPAVYSNCTNSTSTITPALYFIYKGPDVLNPDLGFALNSSGNGVTLPSILQINNYTAYAIMEPANSGGFNITQMYASAGYNLTNPKASGYVEINRPDCSLVGSDVVCTQAQEMQNFANWYMYYRGRMRTAIGAIADTFAKDYGMEYRIGWGTYAGTRNIDSLGNFFGIVSGLRVYDDTQRANLYRFLNGLEYATSLNSTPTPQALNGIGQYFMASGNRGAWGAVPGQNDTSPQVTCRKNYAILFTDGGWNEAINTFGNVDGNQGPPYADSYNNTLADIAMFYWLNDLRPDMVNNVSASGADSATWQHLVTHTVGFGVTGTLNPETDLEGLRNGTLQWPSAGTSASDPRRIDDLWHTAINGRGTFSSASNVSDLVTSLGSIMESMAATSLPSMHRVSASNYLEESNRSYKPSYITGTWAGDLTAYTVSATPTTPANTPLWSAAEKLPMPVERNIWIGTKNSDTGVYNNAIEFTWNSVKEDTYLTENVFNLTPTTSTDTVDAKNGDLINFLRGENSQVATRDYRIREQNNVLGDIVNSNPVYAGKGTSLGYGVLPAAANGKYHYSTYLAWKKTRTPMIFVGANDGMLHAFNASDAADGGGVEAFAYIPSFVAKKLPLLASNDFAEDHQYLLDGPLTLTDAAIGKSDCGIIGEEDSFSCWRNVLVGTAGAGAKGVFALDVTDPTVYSHAPTRAQIKETILWEVTPENTGMANLGFLLQPVQAGYARSENGGRWIAMFGNGAHSTSGAASLFIVDLSNGNLIKEIVVDNTGGNGLMGVTPIYNENKVIIGAYAGDLKGNLWRFDLQDHQESAWTSKFQDSNHKPQPLYKSGRPIFQAPAFVDYSWIEEGVSKTGHMVVFGTGKYYDLSDKSDQAIDALYGILDRGTKGNVGVGTGKILTRELQLLTVDGEQYYGLSNTNDINLNVQDGWMVKLQNVGLGQRSIYTPVLSGSTALFSTVFTGASVQSSEDCDIKALSFGLVAVNLFSGNYPNIKWVDTNNDGIIDDRDQPYAGYPTGDQGGVDAFTRPGLDGGNVSDNVACGDGYFLQEVNGVSVCTKAYDTTVWEQLL